MTTLIDRLVGIDPGSPLDTSFAARAEARGQAELGYQLLLHPGDGGAVSLLERHAVAAFVAVLHDQPESREHYRALLGRSDAGGVAAVVLREAEAARTSGPYGHFPKGPLSVEDRAGLVYRVPSQARAVLGDRLSAALEQAHRQALAQCANACEQLIQRMGELQANKDGWLAYALHSDLNDTPL